MKYSDHYILAEYLAGSYNIDAPLCRFAFALGNVLPDINKLTYLQGYGKLLDRLTDLGRSLTLDDRRKLLIAGHTAEGSRYYINKNTKKIKEKYHSACSSRVGILTWYKLGVLTHYTADRFTYPHTLRTKMAFKAHVDYEEQLHKVFPMIMERLSHENKGRRVKALALLRLRDVEFDTLYRVFREDGDKIPDPYDNCMFIMAACIKYMDYIMSSQRY